MLLEIILKDVLAILSVIRYWLSQEGFFIKFFILDTTQLFMRIVGVIFLTHLLICCFFLLGILKLKWGLSLLI